MRLSLALVFRFVDFLRFFCLVVGSLLFVGGAERPIAVLGVFPLLSFLVEVLFIISAR